MPSTEPYDNSTHHRIPTDELAPPDLDRILKKRRKWYYRLVHPDLPALPRAVQLPLTCATICLSAVQANGVYVWPTYGPVVMRKLELSGTEGQTIVVGGILGVYIMAAPLGSLTDRHGPRFGSFMSALLAALGYLSFAFTLRYATPDTPYVHLCLTLSYFAIGAATVGSYFAALTCASLSFPSHPTLSLSVPLAILSLSSLVLSSFCSLPAFIDRSPETYGELDAVKFLIFLGIGCAGVNIFSSLFMRILDTPIQLLDDEDRESLDEYDDDGEPRSPVSQLLHLDEHTPLIIGGPNAAREDAEAVVRGKERWTAKRLIGDLGGFWAFGILLALCIGPSETVIASIGSILTSLLPPSALSSPLSPSLLLASVSPPVPSPSEALVLRNKHVSILSISGTISRLLTGLIADHLAPPLTPVRVPHGPGQTDMNASMHIYVQRKPVKLLRGTFNAVCAVLLAGVFAWSAGWLESERGLWVLSAGTGVMYGALFTLTPAIVSAHFGPTNFGLAWGLISYFAAIGAVVFSYLYAFISSAIASIPNHSGVPGAPDQGASLFKTQQPPTCYGTRCFSATLWIASACCVISGTGMFWIGRKWKV